MRAVKRSPGILKTASPKHRAVLMCFPNHQWFLMFSAVWGLIENGAHCMEFVRTMCTPDTLLSSIISFTEDQLPKTSGKPQEYLWQVKCCLSNAYSAWGSSHVVSHLMLKTARKSHYIPHFTEKETGSERLRKWPKTTQRKPGFKPRQRGPTEHALIHQLLWVDGD